MRILIVTNLFRPVTLGGYERGCAEFADWASAAGHDVVVLTTELTDQPAGVADPAGLRVERSLVSYRELDGTFRTGPLRWRLGVERLNARALDRVLAEAQPDAVMWWNLGGLTLSLVERVRRRAIPACGIVNDHWLTWAPDVDGWNRAARRAPWLGAVADVCLGIPRRVAWAEAARWVFVSAEVRAEAEAAVGPLPGTAIVPSGIQLEAFPLQPDAPWRGRMLFVGRVTANKGADRAVDALERLPGTELTLCGPRDASLGRPFEREIRARGLGRRVRFVEHATPAGIAREHAAHDVALFPGRWAEPWGKAPLEAMASGVPVVMSATGGAAAYARDGENCLIAAEPQELADAVLRLQDDPALRAQLVRGGRETALRYSAEAACEQRMMAVQLAVEEHGDPSAVHQAAPRASAAA